MKARERLFCFSEVCLRCRLVLPHWLPLPLTGFPAPYPPARARRALFPSGEGGIYSYLMQGASPLASPGSEPARHWGRGEPRAQWEACPCLVGSACPSFALAPYPPDPLPPAGKGGFIVILCKGLRPRHPGLNLRGAGVGANYVLGGRRAFLVSGCHCL